MSSEELMQEIGDKYRLCTCNEAYISRGLNAPDCPWHSYLVQEAMEEFAIAMCEEQKKQCHAAASIQSLPNTIFKAILETKNVAE